MAWPSAEFGLLKSPHLPPPEKKNKPTLAALGVVSTLGLSTLPLASYAVGEKYATGTDPVFDTTDVTVTVGQSISLELSTATVALGTVNANAIAKASEAMTAVVKTNATSYTLNLKANDDMLGQADIDDESIPVGTPTLGTSAWGYSMDGGSNWSPLSKTGTDLSTTAKDEGTDTYSVTFGVSIAANQAAGNYKGTVTFTATAQ